MKSNTRSRSLFLISELLLALTLFSYIIYAVAITNGDVATALQDLATDKTTYAEKEPVLITATLHQEANATLDYQTVAVYVNDNIVGYTYSGHDGGIHYTLFTPFMDPGAYELKLVFEGSSTFIDEESVLYSGSEAVTSFVIGVEVAELK